MVLLLVQKPFLFQLLLQLLVFLLDLVASLDKEIVAFVDLFIQSFNPSLIIKCELRPIPLELADTSGRSLGALMLIIKLIFDGLEFPCEGALRFGGPYSWLSSTGRSCELANGASRLS